jgi:hypothetical protein
MNKKWEGAALSATSKSGEINVAREKVITQAPMSFRRDK